MAAEAPTTGLCVFAISPTLLPLHRLLYYLSLLLSLVYPTPPPLIKGAFAYSLTTSAIAALYAIILALPHPASLSQPQNLDVVSLWAILSSAAISLPMFLKWNMNVRNPVNPVRMIVRIWGVLVLAGTACAFVCLRQVHRVAGGLGTATGTLDQCQGLDAGRTLRDIHTVKVMDLAALTTAAFERVWKVTPALTFVPLAVGALACIFSTPRKEKDAGALHGPEFTISDDLLDNRWSRAFGIVRSLYEPLSTLIVWASPPIWIVVLVFNEIFLLQNGGMALPRTEELYEVGQWGVWAGLAFVVAAGCVDFFAGHGGKRIRVIPYEAQGLDDGVDFGGVGRVV